MPFPVQAASCATYLTLAWGIVDPCNRCAVILCTTECVHGRFGVGVYKVLLYSSTCEVGRVLKQAGAEMEDVPESTDAKPTELLRDSGRPSPMVSIPDCVLTV